MAIGRISVKTGGKGRGESHAKYILRQDKYKLQADKKEKLGDTHSGNMPSWAKDNPMLFWRLADEKERKNGSVYREHILSLPRELNDKQQLQLVKDWINQELGDKHPYTFAIHRPLAMDGKEQPHCHLMFCERELDGIERGGDTFFKRYNSKNPEKGGARKTNTGLTYTEREEQLKQQRERWGELVNKHLKKAKSKSRVDMRNWEERGLSKKPINLTMKQFKVYGDEFTKNKIELAKKQRQENRKLAVKKTIDKVKGGIAETVGDIKKGLDILTVSIHADIVSEKEQAEQQRIAEQQHKAEQEYRELERLKGLSQKDILDEFFHEQDRLAEKILNREIKKFLKEKKPIIDSYNEYYDKKSGKLKKGEPLLFGKDEYREKLEKVNKDYRLIKKQYQEIKNKDIKYYREQAKEQLAKDKPILYELGMKVVRECAEIIKEQERLAEQARQQAEQQQQQQQQQERQERARTKQVNRDDKGR